MIYGTYRETRKRTLPTVLELKDVPDTTPKDLMKWRPGLSVTEHGLMVLHHR
jgi:hypothetical protein